jgi:hypothetical protein
MVREGNPNHIRVGADGDRGLAVCPARGGRGCYDEDVAAEASGNFVYTVNANYRTASYKVNAYVATANGMVSAFTVDSYSGTLTPVPGSAFASCAGTGGVTLLTIDPAASICIAALLLFFHKSLCGPLANSYGSRLNYRAAEPVRRRVTRLSKCGFAAR